MNSFNLVTAVKYSDSDPVCFVVDLTYPIMESFTVDGDLNIEESVFSSLFSSPCVVTVLVCSMARRVLGLCLIGSLVVPA